MMTYYTLWMLATLSQSPQGTSKQIEVGTCSAVEAIHQLLAVRRIAMIVTIQGATLLKVGNIVTVHAHWMYNLMLVETNGTFRNSLPVASDFTNAKMLFG